MESPRNIARYWMTPWRLVLGLVIPLNLSAYQQGSPALSREAPIGSVREEVMALAEEHYRLGLAYLASPESTEKAVAHLEKAAALDRANAEYHFILAEAYARDFSYANIFRKPFLAMKVRTQLERAVQYAPTSIEYREELIRYYLSAPAWFGGSTERARQHANVLGTYDAYFGLLAHANISAEAGEHEKANAEYLRAIAMRPTAWQGYERYGLYCLNIREYDRAIAQMRTLVQLLPSEPRSHEHLADAYVHKRLYDLAIESYLLAFELDRSRVQLLFRIAQLYEFMGSREHAAKYYQTYVTLAPSGRLANDARQRLSELRF